MILADAFDAFLLDLDGVVWRGESPIPRADETIAALRERGKKVIFVTNNSSRSPRDYAMKLARMKIPTRNDDIVTSGHAVLAELERIGLGAGDKVFVSGGDGLVRLLTHERLVPVREGDPTDVGALVVGWNPRGTYEDIRKAADLARAGVPFIASNTDATYPMEDGVVPGTGAIVAAIEVASGVRCTPVGKPQPVLFRLALDRAGVPAERALFIGDRPETDLVGARAAGIPFALVLTGVTDERALGTLPDVPDELLESLDDLLRDLPRPRIVRETDELVAVEGGELARLGVSKVGTTTMLRELRVPVHFGPDASWRVVRRLLIEAVTGAERVEAAAELQPYVERLGIDGTGQGALFSV